MADKVRTNRPIAHDGFEHRLLGPQHLAVQRCLLAQEMLALIGEVKDGGVLSPQAEQTLETCMVHVRHLCQVLQQKHKAPAEPRESLYQLMGQKGEV